MITLTFCKGPLTDPLYHAPLQINFEPAYLHSRSIAIDESL